MDNSVCKAIRDEYILIFNNNLEAKLDTIRDELRVNLNSDFNAKLDKKLDPILTELKSLSRSFDSFKKDMNERWWKERKQKIYGENVYRNFLEPKNTYLPPQRKNQSIYCDILEKKFENIKVPPIKNFWNC